MKQIALIGIGQALLILGVLISHKNKSTRDYLFSFFLILVISELFYRYIKFAGILSEHLYLNYIVIVTWALFGPVYKLFIDFTFDVNKRIKIKHLLYFLPTFFILAVIPIKIIGETGIIRMDSYDGIQKRLIEIAFLIWDISPIIFIALTLKVIFLRNDSANLSYLKFFSVGIAAIVGSVSILRLTGKFIPILFDFNFVDYVVPFIALYVFGMGYLFYINKDAFWEKVSQSVNNNINKIRNNIENNKYIRSGLQNSEKNLILSKLNELLNNDKIYVEFDLTIQDVADKIGTKVNKLSQVINETYNKNFFDFINFHRVKEAKKLIENPDYYNTKILAIAYDSGFGSKSTFYSTFKKHTDMTPTQYKNQIYQNSCILASA